MMEFEFLVYRELLREALFRLWNFLLLTLGLGSEMPNVSWVRPVRSLAHQPCRSC